MAAEEEDDDNGARIAEAARGLWLCPSSGGVSTANGNTDPRNPVSYGINFRITGGSLPRWRKPASYRRPTQVILAHDSVEPRMEDRQGDSLSDYGTGTNLTQWQPPLGVGYATGLHRDPLSEYYRHKRRSNVLWLDGHVEPIAESLGADVPAAWYEGR